MDPSTPLNASLLFFDAENFTMDELMQGTDNGKIHFRNMNYESPPSNPSDPNLQASENLRPAVENHNLESERSVPVEDSNMDSLIQDAGTDNDNIHSRNMNYQSAPANPSDLTDSLLQEKEIDSEKFYSCNANYQSPLSDPSNQNLHALKSFCPVIENHNLDSEPRHSPVYHTWPTDRAKPEDAEALKRLNDVDMTSIGPIQNCFLEVEPSQIPEQQRCFFTNKFDLLHEDTLSLKSGSWRKHHREWGWSISFSGIWGMKRTFDFHTINKRNKDTKTNWILNVYALLFDFDIMTEVYLCEVFQSNNYDPRPTGPGYHQTVEKGIKYKLKAMSKGLFTSTGDENYEPNISVLPTRVASGKRRKNDDHELPGPSIARDICFTEELLEAWSSPMAELNRGSGSSFSPLAAQYSDPVLARGRLMAPFQIQPNLRHGPTENELPGQSTTGYNFTEVKACSGPAGNMLALSICNHCGKVYRSSSGPATLKRHTDTCKNVCKTTPTVSK